ncbi:MAG: endonuclease III domain-containing protein, partial [Candidatus Brocadiales bacterium]
MGNSERLLKIYNHLFESFGSQHWWPGETPFEVIVGAILTQNTNWGNAAKAINNLKKANMLSPEKLHEINIQKLARLIRPSGFFNMKARKLKTFMTWFFNQYQG